MISEGSFSSLLPGFWFQERQLPPQLKQFRQRSASNVL